MVISNALGVLRLDQFELFVALALFAELTRAEYAAKHRDVLHTLLGKH